LYRLTNTWYFQYVDPGHDPMFDPAEVAQVPKNNLVDATCEK